MLEKIIELLLSLTLKWTEKEPYKKQMKPVSLFLEHQMAILREYLYPTCLKAVVKELWQCVLNVSINHIYIYDVFDSISSTPKHPPDKY